ncbi:WD40 repeat-like protein [Boletus edulis BED1]|uniref:WD40 repeat-like protein n=1 Tax=Boletus edulis BED1 TaxID=1328754 RepID=A0AAD4C297_BOLED|nr:WD40 repeat-like protein [Boletus edulis BED1]
MPEYEFDIAMHEDDDDDEAFDGPDAYLEGDDNILELEDEVHSQGSRGSIAEILRSLFDLQQLHPGNATERTTSSGTNEGNSIYGDLVRLLQAGPSSGDQDEEDDQVDDDDEYLTGSPWHRQWYPPHTEPQKTGVELLMSGEFGRVSNKLRSNKGSKNVSRLLLDRSCNPRGILSKEELSSGLIPNSNGTAVASNGSNLYAGQFSKDSSFYYTCCQDFRLHVYDMTSPPAKYIKPWRNPQRRTTLPSDHDRDHESTLKVLKVIQGHPGRWTITDSHLSPDNERMIYSSISPTVYMTNTLDSSTVQTPIHFANQDRRQSRSLWGIYDDDSFGIWSCRFSADGNEVIAGGDGHIFVYDLLADRRTVKIKAHSDDVNSCCWADTASGNVLISASDDMFLKVWDRRSLGGSRKPSGVLVGHTEGIAFVSAKGDGRYVISNGKDQALRLWDLRKMCGSDDFDSFARLDYRCRDYDYRYGHFPKPRRPAHPKDCSVMTYRGHAVLRTLIRCNFSPAETTGGQYIYSGSADGRIHIWSLDGRIVQVLDRSRTLPISYDPSGPEPEPLTASRATVCVRDVSWSSREPVLMSVGWESSRVGGSIVARHEWKGLSKMANSLEDFVEKQRIEISQRAMTRATGYRRRPQSNHRLQVMARLFGFPPGYFVIRSAATSRLWDVTLDEVEDGTPVILWPEKEHSLVEGLRNPEANNQVFFIDTSGALCSRASGHAIDVEGDSIVVRHRRPVSQPYPNAYSHPLPQFSYHQETQEISVSFSCDPTYPPPGSAGSDGWQRRKYILSSVPMRRPKSLIDNASALISATVAAPLSFFSGNVSTQPKSTPEEVFGGDIDLGEDEILEQDRGEEGEVDDSLELHRNLRLLSIDPRGALPEGTSARKRRQWQVLALRTRSATRRSQS